MSNEFLANIKNDGDKFNFNNLNHSEPDDKGKDTPPAPPADNKTKTQEPPQGGEHTPDDKDIPFHKHPRWIANQAELADLRKFKDEVSPKLTALEQRQQEAAKGSEKLPDWWIKMYGNETQSVEAYQIYSNHELESRKQIKEEIIKEQTQQQEAQKAEVKKWESHIESQINTLKDEGLEFDRNELLKVVDDYSPRDEKGQLLGFIDFKKAYDILNFQKGTKQADKSNTRKQIAAKTGSEKSGGDGKQTNGVTLKELREKGWDGWKE